MPSRSLRRFWIQLETPVRGLHSFGATAFDIADALTLIADYLGADALPDAATVVEDIDVEALDANHILPNIGPPVFRGIWYPATSLH